MGLAIGDLNRDGKMDFFHTAIYYTNKSCPLFTCNFGTIGNALYTGIGNKKFSLATEKVCKTKS